MLHLLNRFCIFVKHKLVFIWICFMDFISCFINLCDISPVISPCLEHCSYVLGLKNLVELFLHFILFFPQNHFNYSNSSAFPHKFQDRLIYMKTFTGILIGITISLSINFRELSYATFKFANTVHLHLFDFFHQCCVIWSIQVLIMVC